LPTAGTLIIWKCRASTRFRLPGALEERGAAIARAVRFLRAPERANSARPGSRSFLPMAPRHSRRAAALFERSPAGTLLAESGILAIAQALKVPATTARSL
jgi:hypothetical protein